MPARIFCLIVSLLLPTFAMARQATLTFVGTVESVDTGVAVPYDISGTPITGTVVFDYSPEKYTSGGFPSAGSVYAYYTYSGESYSFSASLTGIDVSTPYVGVEVYDNGSRLDNYPTDTLTVSTKRRNVLYVLQLTGPNDSFSGTGLPTHEVFETFWTSAKFSFSPPAREKDA